MSRGTGQGARVISESFTQLLFALPVPLAGWPEGWVPSQRWLQPTGLAVPPSLAVPRGHSWCQGLEEEGSCVKLLPFAKVYGTPCILGHAGPVLSWFGLDFCVAIGSRAVQLRSFHGDALLGYSPVPWAPHSPQGSLCAPAKCTSLKHWRMRGWGKEVSVQRIPSLSMLY